jgi:hypothetical protein
MTLLTAIERLQELAAECTGVKYSPTYPPEKALVYPFTIAFPETGQMGSEAKSQARDIHTVIVEFHVAPNLQRNAAIEKAIPLIEEYSHKLVNDPTLAGAVGNIVFPITYDFGALRWGETEDIGFRWRIPLKIRSAV